jgi:hypothetical protein
MRSTFLGTARKIRRSQIKIFKHRFEGKAERLNQKLKSKSANATRVIFDSQAPPGPVFRRLTGSWVGLLCLINIKTID